MISDRWNKLVRENENRRIRILYLEAIAENGSASVQDRYLGAVADPGTVSIQDRLPGPFAPLESACKRSSIIAVAAFRTSSYHEIEWSRHPGHTDPFTGTLLGTLTMKKVLKGQGPAKRHPGNLDPGRRSKAAASRRRTLYLLRREDPAGTLGDQGASDCRREYSRHRFCGRRTLNSVLIQG